MEMPILPPIAPIKLSGRAGKDGLSHAPVSIGLLEEILAQIPPWIRVK